ncbi:hypothetical protein VSDG_04134 [Cytospora chrysosperma]|uniref:C2H2-type domain-containing protein n=1 Tax=Cytospora chrysosperma TaxID=252740 RepID=A0A423W0Z8_CYTCH|nr:hypothetical protein VSDG_04134 [Valsa sordida]
MNTADEGLQKYESKLGSHSATTSVAESKVSKGFTSSSVSREPVQPNFGRVQPGMAAGSRSPSRPGSPNGSLSSRDKDLKLSEESDEAAYETLVENIKSLVIDSPCVDDLKDRGVPLESYTHWFLEQVSNHRDSSFQRHTSALPIRTLPIRVCNPGANVAKSQAPRGGGRGGNDGNNKRKNGENNGAGRGSRDKENNDSYDDADDGSEDDSEQPKRQKTGDEHDGNYICPYREHNALRFNVRTHPYCALSSFKSLTLLKRHIKNFHRRSANESHRCHRCRCSFPDEETLVNHQRDDKRCEVAPDPDVYEDPEDGISTSVMQKLAGRAKGTKISSWEAIWRLLFPQDEYVPGLEKYEPPVELDEVEDKLRDREFLTSFLENKSSVWYSEASVGGHGFTYILEVADHCRRHLGHEESPTRIKLGKKFLKMVEEVLNPGYSQPPYRQEDYVVGLDLPLPRHPIHTFSNQFTEYAAQGPYDINGQASTAANQDMTMFSTNPNAPQFPPPLVRLMGNAYPTQNGALSQHQNFNNSSEFSDSAYQSIPPTQGPGSGQPGQAHINCQDECPVNPQTAFDLRESDFNYAGFCQDGLTSVEDFNQSADMNWAHGGSLGAH